MKTAPSNGHEKATQDSQIAIEISCKYKQCVAHKTRMHRTYRQVKTSQFPNVHGTKSIPMDQFSTRVYNEENISTTINIQ